MKRRWNLPDFSMRHPVTVSMAVVTVIGFGLIALQRTSVEFMPPMDFPFLGAFIPYPGATPAQVEQEIAIPAEGEFQTISGLKHMFSNSSSEGCFIGVEFDWGVDMSQALADMRDRIERLRLVMPESADRIFVRHFKLESVPVLMMGLSREGDYDEFIDRVDRDVLPKLQRVDGVANVELMGYEPKSIMVDIDQQAMLAHGVSLYELIMTLNVANVDVGVGELYEGGQKHFVRAEGKMEGIADYAELRLGNGLHLRDVATGGYRSREQDWHMSIDGNRQVFMMITKDSSANAVEVCSRVMDELDRALAHPTLKGTEKHVFFNQGTMIEGALSGLKKSAVIGAGLSIAVLFFFMWRIRPTLIVALSIPASMVAALLFMYASGMSLNMITMMSLIIAVGMVVDNSIVVMENMYRHQELGTEIKESCRRGAAEVGLAVVASTATSVAVFLPVFFMDTGQLSVFTRQFALPVSVAMIASLIIALSVIPLAVSKLRRHKRTPMERLRQWQVRSTASAAMSPIGWVRGAYIAGLRWSVRNRVGAVILLVALIVLTATVPMRKMPFRAVPQLDQRMIEVDIELDPNYDMAAADQIFSEVASMLDARRDELGIKNVLKDYTARGGEIQAFLVQHDDLPAGESYSYTTDEVMDIVWQLLPERAPGARFTVSTGGEERGAGSEQTRISLRLQGDDAETLERMSEVLIAEIERMPGLTDVRKSTERAQQEIRLRVDNILAERAGIDATQVAQTVGFALMGTELSRIKQGGREISVWAQFQEADRRDRANLDNVMLAGQGGEGGEGAGGQLVTLNQLITTSKGVTPQVINRRDGKNFIFITASAARGDFMRAMGALQKLVTDFELPVGYSLGFGDEIANLQEDRNNFGSTLIMSLLLIYVVMAALFESLILPMSILTTVPLAFMGVAWVIFGASLYSNGVAMDTIGFIGCVLMVGVVVNNGIVIVDRINSLRREGMEREAAIMQAGADRLRPVLMTALTTILGSLPLVAPLIFPRIGNPATISLGCAMIGGLTTGTFLTLYVVPLFYTMLDDLQGWFARYCSGVAALFRRRRADKAAL